METAIETPRPLVHFTPPRDWLNDPNGLVFLDDEWHVFYQYQPPDSHERHWGHAVSRDLFGWEHLPVALYPDELGAIWSGSCVVDWHNTSGFFPGGRGLVAFFTHQKHTPSGEKQRQSLAYSRDNGRTWTKYEHNPVLTSDKTDFRDPKVFWHAPSDSWVMIVAAGAQVELFRSGDLKTWNFASAFGAGRAPGAVWECPDLFSLPNGNGGEVWILLSSFLNRDNFQGKFSPCFAAYFAGNFDGHTFTAFEGENSAGRRVSWGPDDYAPVTFAEAPGGRRVLLGWLNHWGYAGDLVTSPWTGQMTLPRELSWQDNALVQSLPPEWDAARSWPCVELRPAGPGEAQARFDGPVWELVVPPLGRDAWRLEARHNDLLLFWLERDAARGVWAMERTAASLPPIPENKPGRNAFFTARYDAPVANDEPASDTRIVVDTCSVEVFGDGGRTLFCFQIFPPGGGGAAAAWQVTLDARGE